MVQPSTPQEAEAAMLEGFRGEVLERPDNAEPGEQWATCPQCWHSFPVPPPPAG